MICICVCACVYKYDYLITSVLDGYALDDQLDWICLTTTHVLQDILAVLHK